VVKQTQLVIAMWKEYLLANLNRTIQHCQHALKLYIFQFELLCGSVNLLLFMHFITYVSSVKLSCGPSNVASSSDWSLSHSCFQIAKWVI